MIPKDILDRHGLRDITQWSSGSVNIHVIHFLRFDLSGNYSIGHFGGNVNLLIIPTVVEIVILECNIHVVL
jgi:hypothetical protein